MCRHSFGTVPLSCIRLSDIKQEGADLFACAGAGANAPPVSSDADTPWRAYLPLWQALFSSGAQPGAPDQDAEGPPAWSQALYDALLGAALDALRSLDLRYSQAADAVALPAHAASDEVGIWCALSIA